MDNSAAVLAAILDLKTRMQQMEDERRAEKEAAEEAAEQPDYQEEEVNETEEARGAEATPDSLRRDMRLMAKAAEKLSRLSTDDSDGEEEGILRTTRKKGRKSGSLMMASDIVRKRIDWPHLYIKRVVAGRRKPVAFSDIRLEEFALGYLRMLDAPGSKMNYKQMIDLLKMVLQDTMEFSWANAVGFYEQVALEVEEGTMSWDDTDIIKDMRVTYSRTILPDKKEQKEPAKAGVRVNTQSSRSCALYQKKACELQRDHHPFLHTCAYCYRTCNAIFRHPEADCQRKIADEAKNGKRRE